MVDPTPTANIGNVSKSSTLSSTSSKSNSLAKNSSLDAPNTASQKHQQHSRQPVTSSANFLLSSAIDIDIINSLVVHPQAQLHISEYMARKNPELTMFLIAELTSRMEQCSSLSGKCGQNSSFVHLNTFKIRFKVRRTMLEILIPWFQNIDLVDPNVVATSARSSSCLYMGSVESTQLILNNLFYLTHKFLSELDAQLELLWAILVTTSPTNLKIVCRYVFVMITLATYEMLGIGKRVACYVARACPETYRLVVDELVAELQCMDSYAASIERNEQQLPFYRYTRLVAVHSSPPPPSPQPGLLPPIGYYHHLF